MKQGEVCDAQGQDGAVNLIALPCAPHVVLYELPKSLP